LEEDEDPPARAAEKIPAEGKQQQASSKALTAPLLLTGDRRSTSRATVG
jgi:hypothetical protein